MVRPRPSALVLGAALSAAPLSAVPLCTALLACSREPQQEPQPRPPAAASSGADGAAIATATALPSSASAPPMPPIGVSPLIRSVSTVSARDYRDFPASIPDVLTIRAPNLDSRSHGIGDEPWRAT